MCRGGCGHDNHEIHAIFRLTHGCLQQRKLIRNKQILLLGIFDFPLISGNYQQTNEGKRPSRTRCPVRRGWLAGSFSVTGLG